MCAFKKMFFLFLFSLTTTMQALTTNHQLQHVRTASQLSMVNSLAIAGPNLLTWNSPINLATSSIPPEFYALVYLPNFKAIASYGTAQGSLYFPTYYNYLCYSTDNGNSWNSFPNSSQNPPYCITNSNQIALVMDNNGNAVYMSQDGNNGSTGILSSWYYSNVTNSWSSIQNPPFTYSTYFQLVNYNNSVTCVVFNAGTLYVYQFDTTTPTNGWTQVYSYVPSYSFSYLIGPIALDQNANGDIVALYDVENINESFNFISGMFYSHLTHTWTAYTNIPTKQYAQPDVNINTDGSYIATCVDYVNNGLVLLSSNISSLCDNVKLIQNSSFAYSYLCHYNDSYSYIAWMDTNNKSHLSKLIFPTSSSNEVPTMEHISSLQFAETFATYASSAESQLFLAYDPTISYLYIVSFGPLTSDPSLNTFITQSNVFKISSSSLQSIQNPISTQPCNIVTNSGKVILIGVNGTSPYISTIIPGTANTSQ